MTPVETLLLGEVVEHVTSAVKHSQHGYYDIAAAAMQRARQLHEVLEYAGRLEARVAALERQVTERASK